MSEKHEDRTVEDEDLAAAAMDQVAKYDVAGGATMEVVSAKDAEDLNYLSKEMLTDGSARNIVTVKITTAKASFKVDVLKANPMQRIYKSKNKERLIEISRQPKDAPLSDDLLELNHEENRETISDYIVNPKISLTPSDNTLHIDEIPDDVQDLLIGAYEKVNNPRGVSQAVQTFPETDGNG